MINSTFGGFMTARLGMAAAQHGLNLTGHNLTNSATEGYTRQRIDQVSINYSGTYRYASKYNVNVGNGVLVKGISQLRDPFLDLRYRNEMAHVGYEEIKTSVYNDLADILDEVKNSSEDAISGGGIFNQLGNILEKFQQLSNEVGNKEFDSMVKTASQQLTTLLNSYSKRINEVEENLTSDLTKVDGPRVNEILQSISELNRSIKSSEIHGEGALELKDERNLLIDELSKYMKIKVTYKPVQISDSTVVDELSIAMDNSDANGKDYVLVDDQQYRQLEWNQDKDGNWNITMTAMKVDAKPNQNPPVDPDVDATLKAAERVLAAAKLQNNPYQLAETFKDAHNSLSDAMTAYNTANTNLTQAETNYQKMKDAWDATYKSLITAQSDLAKLTDATAIANKQAEIAKLTTQLQTDVKNRDTAREAYNTALSAANKANASYKTAQTAYETALKNLPKDPSNAAFPSDNSTVDLTKANANAPVYDADGNQVSQINYTGLVDKNGNAITTNLLTGKTLEGGNAVQDAYDAAVNNHAAAKAAWDQSVLDSAAPTTKDPATGNDVPIIMNDAFTDGKLRGTLEMLNKEGDYDGTDIRGIGYYKNMLDTFANTFANEMNKLNGTGKPLFTTEGGATTGITASNIRIAEGWMDNTYGITASTQDDPTNPGQTVEGANDNILRFIMLFGKDVSFTTKLDDGLATTPAGKEVFNGTFEEAFTNIGVTLGLDIKGTSENLENYQLLASSISEDREGATGVNLDEEAMHIMQYSQSYNASARLMTALDEMLNTLITNTGVVGR